MVTSIAVSLSISLAKAENSSFPLLNVVLQAYRTESRYRWPCEFFMFDMKMVFTEYSYYI